MIIISTIIVIICTLGIAYISEELARYLNKKFHLDYGKSLYIIGFSLYLLFIGIFIQIAYNLTN